MNNFFQKDSASYEYKINKIIEALEEQAVYLRQINEKLNKLSAEWQVIKESLLYYLDNNMEENVNSGDFDTEKKTQNCTTDKEMEELILCIVKEVNNHHIEFVCLN
ncbi:MAG: hypothetical protein PHF74_06535 [Dehalococcoidales bacterium]|nr:hypothetical protein [Dehalococcoidales bacterium]